MPHDASEPIGTVAPAGSVAAFLASPEAAEGLSDDDIARAFTADQPRADAIAALLDAAVRPFVSPQQRGALVDAIVAALAPADPTADLRAALRAIEGEAMEVIEYQHGQPVRVLEAIAERARAALAASTTEEGS